MTLAEHRADAEPDGVALGRTAARAVLWNYLSFASGKLLVLATMVVLARLLTPQEFGIVAFATVAVNWLGVLKDLGLGGAVIQRRDDTEESAQTVYVLNLVMSGLLTAGTALAAPAVAAFFREPLVIPILRVLSFTFLIQALGAVHVVLLRRNLDFRRKMIPDVGQAVVKGIASVAFALAGFGVWALVWGQLIGALAATLLAWVVIPWKPRFRVHRRLVRPLMRFGMPLMLTDIQAAVWSNLDYVIVGRLLGDTALGIYTLAYRLPELLILSVWRVLGGAIFPFFASIQRFPDLLRKGFLATIRYSQIVVVPLCVGLFITAGPAVEVLFGDKWADAIPVLRLLAVFALVGSIGVNIGDVYKAIGRPDLLAKLAFVELALLTPALILGARHGLIGVAAAHAVVAAIDTTIRLTVARRFVHVTFRDIGRQLLPSLQAGAALGLVAAGALWAASPAGPVAALAATVVAGAAAYFTVLYRVDREAVRRLAGWVGLRHRAPAVEEVGP
ncbi:MAG: lipopolysaccharide biosynthesis protein [Acidimicrobiia bacterium]|nr:lipopolysaccharide biosynthesis protein [Acidimicrobiia bacterium]